MLKVAQRHTGGVLMKTTRRYWNKNQQFFRYLFSNPCYTVLFLFICIQDNSLSSGVCVCLLTIIVGSTLHSSIRRGQKSSQALTILLENKTHMCITNFCRSLKKQKQQQHTPLLMRHHHLWHIRLIVPQHKHNVLPSNWHTASAPQNKALCTAKIIYMQNNSHYVTHTHTQRWNQG